MKSQADQKEFHGLEMKVSVLLRIGVMVSGACLLMGWLGQLWNDGETLFSLSRYEPEPLFQRVQWAILTQDRPLMMALIGLVILVFLPVIRVAMTGILFVRQKEYRLGFMAFAVLGTLIASFCLGIDL